MNEKSEGQPSNYERAIRFSTSLTNFKSEFLSGGDIDDDKRKKAQQAFVLLEQEFQYFNENNLKNVLTQAWDGVPSDEERFNQIKAEYLDLYASPLPSEPEPEPEVTPEAEPTPEELELRELQEFLDNLDLGPDGVVKQYKELVSASQNLLVNSFRKYNDSEILKHLPDPRKIKSHDPISNELKEIDLQDTTKMIADQVFLPFLNMIEEKFQGGDYDKTQAIIWFKSHILEPAQEFLERINAKVREIDGGGEVEEIEETQTENELVDIEISMPEAPEHSGIEEWRTAFDKRLDLLIHHYGELSGNSEKEKQEKLRQIFNMYLNEANYQILNLIGTDSAPGAKFTGLMKSLIIFFRSDEERKPTKYNTFERLEEILHNAGMSSSEVKSWIYKLGSKGFELLNAMYFDELGRVKGHSDSMASDWEELYKLDSSDPSFNITNFDFMIDPDKRHFGQDKEAGFVYQNSRMMRTIMYLMPQLIRDFEVIKGSIWNDGGGNTSRNQFDRFLGEVLDYLLLKFQFSLDEKSGKLSEEEIRNKKNEIRLMERKLVVPIKTRADFNEEELNHHIIDNRVMLDEKIKRVKLFSLDSSADEKGEWLKVRIKQDEGDKPFYSMGQDEIILMNMQDLQPLLDDIKGQKTHDRKVLYMTAGRMATALGLRQHLFLNDYARGDTPAGGIARHSRFMAIVSPLSQAQYKSYKDLVPNPYVSHFEVDWDTANVGRADEVGLFVMGDPEKARTIEASNQFTRMAIKQGSPLRSDENIIHVGPINDRYDQIQTPYPDPYNFVISSSRRRAAKSMEDKAAGFESYNTGLNKFEEFTNKIMGVPGGTLDLDSIKKKDQKQLRKELVDSLQNIIQNLFSPLKASSEWFRWDHIAQFIILYIDKMFRVYRINDESDQGVVKLTAAIRKTLETSSVNMAKMGASKLKLKQLSEGNYEFEVLPGLVRQHLLDTNKIKISDNIIVISGVGDKKEAERLAKEKLAKQEVKGKAIKREEYQPLKGMKFENLPEVGSEETDLPDIRDYILNFIPVTHEMGKLGFTIYVADRAQFDKRALRIMRYRPNFGVPQLLSTHRQALRAKLLELENREQIEVLKPRINKALLGLPEEDKKAN
jgi:hypothetical protein